MCVRFARVLIVCRVKALREEPYSIKEAEAGRGGLTTDNGKRATRSTTTTLMEVDDGATA
jgi:bud site selection protein 20